MKLSKPIAIRFKPTHRAHLRRRAKEQGHGVEVFVLRQLIEQDMQSARIVRSSQKPHAA